MRFFYLFGMIIYTKKGDGGKTGLFGNKKRVSKASLIIETIGSIDNLNSFLGIIISSSETKEIKNLLKEIQKDLTTINSIIAGSNLEFGKSKVKELEKIIDNFEDKLPPLNRFILPGGSFNASLVHFGRSLTREAERRIVALNEIDRLKPELLIYINRLSDTLFVLARYINFKLRVKEELWKK